MGFDGFALIGVPLLFLLYGFVGTYQAHDFERHLFQYVIVTLSVLAFPHALLMRYCKGAGIIS